MSEIEDIVSNNISGDLDKFEYIETLMKTMDAVDISLRGRISIRKFILRLLSKE